MIGQHHSFLIDAEAPLLCAVAQSGAARFPARNDRDLSGYVPDGSMGGIPTQLVIPPGTSDEDRRAIEAAQVASWGRLCSGDLSVVTVSLSRS